MKREMFLLITKNQDLFDHIEAPKTGKTNLEVVILEPHRCGYDHTVVECNGGMSEFNSVYKYSGIEFFTIGLSGQSWFTGQHQEVFESWEDAGIVYPNISNEVIYFTYTAQSKIPRQVLNLVMDIFLGFVNTRAELQIVEKYGFDSRTGKYVG